MEGVQRGLESTARAELVLAGYQERQAPLVYARLDQVLEGR